MIGGTNGLRGGPIAVCACRSDGSARRNGKFKLEGDLENGFSAKIDQLLHPCFEK